MIIILFAVTECGEKSSFVWWMRHLIYEKEGKCLIDFNNLLGSLHSAKERKWVPLLVCEHFWCSQFCSAHNQPFESSECRKVDSEFPLLDCRLWGPGKIQPVVLQLDSMFGGQTRECLQPFPNVGLIACQTFNILRPIRNFLWQASVIIYLYCRNSAIKSEFGFKKYGCSATKFVCLANARISPWLQFSGSLYANIEKKYILT